MSNPTREEVLASIVPKSDQLNSEDVIASGPITVTITGVKRGSKEQPIIVEIDGHQPYKPCKTMRRVLIAMYSDDAKLWVGQKMTLYTDPNIKFKGVRVGGLRISHLSGIDAPKTFMLTQTRGKKADVVIHPIAPLSPEDQKYITETTATLKAAETLKELQGHGEMLKTKSKPIQDALRPIYKARKDELEPADTIPPKASGIDQSAIVPMEDS